MRILVCGGRKFANRNTLFDTLDLRRKDGEFELGCGYDPNDPKYQGADQLAYEWAISRAVSGRCYPAHWSLYGNSAGPRRNARMLAQFGPNEVWAWPGGRGTADMLEKARAVRPALQIVTVDALGRTSIGRGRNDTSGMLRVWDEVCGPQKEYPPCPTGFGKPRRRR